MSARLPRIVTAVEPLLAAVSEEESLGPALAGGWSRKDLIAHLIDSAANNHLRFLFAAQQGALEFPGYDQDANNALQAPSEVPWPLLVGLWSNYNRYLSHVIARLPADKLEAPCRIGGAAAVTLQFLVDDYIAHLEHHLKQIGVHV